jgi:phosphate transport system protein
MTIGDMSSQQHLRHDEARHRFAETLDEIRVGMVRMGSLVVENTRRAGEVILENRLEVAPAVREADEEINKAYAHLEQISFETLARQQPVARDLRFLVATTRILYELERSGDLAVNCAGIVEKLDGLPDSPKLIGLLARIIDEACSLFARAIEALADLDASAGERLDREDDVVDNLVSRLYHQVGVESEEIGLETAVALSRLGRFLERIGDHAVNIGENIAFIVTAEFPGDTHAALRDES